MPYDAQIHHRRALRLQRHNYTDVGAYFITICTEGRACAFGEIGDRQMKLSDVGTIVDGFWCTVQQKYPQIELDEFVVMPNHIHGLLWILGTAGAESPRPNLSRIVGFYKYQTTRLVNEHLGAPGTKLW